MHNLRPRKEKVVSMWKGRKMLINIQRENLVQKRKIKWMLDKDMKLDF